MSISRKIKIIILSKFIVNFNREYNYLSRKLKTWNTEFKYDWHDAEDEEQWFNKEKEIINRLNKLLNPYNISTTLFTRCFKHYHEECFMWKNIGKKKYWKTIYYHYHPKEVLQYQVCNIKHIHIHTIQVFRDDIIFDIKFIQKNIYY